MLGHLAEEEVRGYLDTGYPADTEDGVSGVFIFPGRSLTSGDVALSLSGVITPDCQIRLEDANGDVWRLRLIDYKRLDGTVERAGVVSPICLSVTAPKDCSGRERWRKFNSPGWPITFEYPASWWLEESEDEVVIECPDAATLAWGGSAISLSKGRGLQPVVNEKGEHGRAVGAFVTFRAGKWLVGECGDPDDLGLHCNPVRKSAWRGMTVLQGSAGEHRRYRAGGGNYVGQGDGIMRYLFIVREPVWVSIDSEVTPTLWSFPADNSPSPVIFGGDGVIERLVRSIRPK